MQRKGFKFIAFFLSGLLWGLLPIGEMRSEDVSTCGWMSVKVLKTENFIYTLGPGAY